MKACCGTSFNWFRMVFSAIACYVVIVAFDAVTWAGPLLPSYAALKRVQISPEARAVQEMWYPILELLLAISITAFYFCWRHKSSASACLTTRAGRIRDALGFGGFIGLFMGISMMSLYISLDIPGIAPIIWALTGFAKGILLGLTLNAFHPNTVTSQS